MGSVSLKVWNDPKYQTKKGFTLWLVVRQDGKRKVFKTGLTVPDPAQ